MLTPCSVYKKLTLLTIESPLPLPRTSPCGRRHWPGSPLPLPPALQNIPLWQKALAGLTAGGLGALVGNPADLTLIRMQVGNISGGGICGQGGREGEGRATSPQL